MRNKGFEFEHTTYELPPFGAELGSMKAYLNGKTIFNYGVNEFLWMILFKLSHKIQPWVMEQFFKDVLQRLYPNYFKTKNTGEITQ